MGGWRSEVVILFVCLTLALLAVSHPQRFDSTCVSSCRAQCEYSSEQWREERYQTEMQEVTAQFSQLSRDLLSHIAWFRGNEQSEAATILETVQMKEKEKLQLVCEL